MTTRMVHPTHGATHAYGAADVDRLKGLGWAVEAQAIKAPVINGDANAPSPAVIEEQKRKPGRPPKVK